MALVHHYILDHRDEKNRVNAEGGISPDSLNDSSVNLGADWTEEEEKKLVRK
jgi:hypothetical protein